MNTSTVTILLLGSFLFGCRGGDADAGGPAAATVSEGGASADVRDGRANAREEGPAPRDADVEPYVRDVLKLAFDAASRMPTDGHAKDRALTQEKVVVAAYELDLPLMAVSWAPYVEGWRRGVAYADFVYHCGRHGLAVDGERYLALARKVVTEVESNPDQQTWRADEIRMKMARAYQAIGNVEQARELGAKVSPDSLDAASDSTARAAASFVDTMPRDAVQAHVDVADAAVRDQTAVLGAQYNAMWVLARIHGRFYADEELRTAIEDRLLFTYEKVPTPIRLELYYRLIANANDAGDTAGSAALLDRLATFVDGFSWRPLEGMPAMAELAALRGMSGQTERASRDLQKLLEWYYEERPKIMTMDRTQCVLPLAVAWHRIGEPEKAIGVLALALEEGMENPNSRPRCFDLVRTCVAMATHRIEPSAEVWERMQEIRDGLTDPW